MPRSEKLSEGLRRYRESRREAYREKDKERLRVYRRSQV